MDGDGRDMKLNKLLSAAATCSLLAALSACASDGAPPADDSGPNLRALAPAESLAAIDAAQRHVLVVRHARRDPACHGLACPLTDEGETEVVRLAEMLADIEFDAVLASAACRTALTAQGASGVTPVVYRAGDDYAEGCEAAGLSPGDFTRSEAITQVAASDATWTLIGDHSNRVCGWMEGLGAGAPAPCTESNVPETDYGDIFWGFQSPDGDWSHVVLVNAFAGDDPAEE